MSFPIRGQKVLSLVFKIIDARLTMGVQGFCVRLDIAAKK